MQECLPKVLETSIILFCHFTIKASKTALRFRKLSGKGFRSNPQTLGQHLLARRLVLGLTHKEVGPTISFWPGLTAFLGYYPYPVETPSAWVLKARRLLGLGQFAFGRRIQVIAQIIRQWEQGLAEPPRELLEKIKALTSTKSCR